MMTLCGRVIGQAAFVLMVKLAVPTEGALEANLGRALGEAQCGRKTPEELAEFLQSELDVRVPSGQAWVALYRQAVQELHAALTGDGITPVVRTRCLALAAEADFLLNMAGPGTRCDNKA